MPSYLLTSPDGKKYRVSGEGTGEEALAELQSQLGAQTPEAPATEPQNEKTFSESMGLGLKKRALGIAELGANALDSVGIPIGGSKELLADVGQNYQREGKGTGFKGLVGEIAGDPLSYLPVASIPKLLGQGALMGATSPTGNSESGLMDNAKGAVGGAAASALGATAGKMIGKVAKPVSNQLGKAGQAAVRTLEEAGVPLTAAQRTGSKALASLESVFSTLPMTSATQGKIYGEQGQAFTKAALGKAGIKADDAGRKVIADAADAFGNEYKTLAANNMMNIDKQLKDAVANIGFKAKGRMGKDTAGVVNSVISDIKKAKGKVSGDVYHETRKMLTQKANSTNDSFDAGLMKQLRNALDDAFDRSLPASERGALANINKRYQSFKPIQKAMESSKTDVLRTGNVDPTALYQQVEVGAPLSDLADAGAALLRPTVPDSGTAQRVMMQNILTGGAAGVGAIGANSENPYAKVAGYGALALAAPRGAQMVYNNKRAQNYLASGMSKPVQAGAKAVQEGLKRGVPSAYSLNNADSQEKQPPEQVRMEPMSFQSTQGDYFQKLAQAESGGNPNAKAKTSSASGLYQFTDGTWMNMVKKHGKETGISMKDKNNPDAQHVFAQLLTKENAEKLTSALGREPTDGDLYVAHFLGSSDAARLIKRVGTGQQAAMIFPKAAKANKSIFYANGKPRTVEEVYQLLTNKVT